MNHVTSAVTPTHRRRRHALALAAFTIAVLSSAASPRASGPGGDTLLSTVREAIAPFRSPDDAMAAGWLPLTGCVSGPQEGAMGTHYINPTLLTDTELDPRKPEALIFEHKNGRATLVGVEFIILADKWKAGHNGPPVLMGQHMHFAGAPNRYGLDPFYELHVWAWRDNPLGTFSDWHRHVSCDDVTGQE
jgi:hypothetical protein